MKKLFSILFAGIILLSGMNFSFAKHLCGGEISAVKFSVTDEKASCGMERIENNCPTQKSFEAENCCKDEITFLTVDKNYNPSTFQLNQPTDQLMQVFYIPEKLGSLLHSPKHSSKTNVQPPGKFLACAVSLPDICVFRI